MSRCFLFFLCILFTNPVIAQVDFLDLISLRKSFETKDDKAEPANLSLTWPRNDTVTRNINLAIGINFAKLQSYRYNIKPIFEYHANNITEKEQNIIKGGLYFDWIISRDSTSQKMIPNLVANINFTDDIQKGITSFQGQYYVTLFMKENKESCKFFWLPNNLSSFGNLLKFEYNPYLGLEQENRIRTDTDSLRGHIFRFAFRIKGKVFLLPLWLRDKLELSAEFQWRYDFVNSTDETDRVHPYFIGQVNLILFKHKKGAIVKIGYDYVKGQNPTKGFENQEYQMLAFKVIL